MSKYYRNLKGMGGRTALRSWILIIAQMVGALTERRVCPKACVLRLGPGLCVGSVLEGGGTFKRSRSLVGGPTVGAVCPWSDWTPVFLYFLAARGAVRI